MLALAAGAGVLGALAVALAAADRADATTTSPLHPPGGWSDVLVVALVAAFVLYLGGLALARGTAPRVWAVLALAVGIQLAPVAVPPLLSSDLYTYWAYGRLAAVHDANPYEVPPSRFPDDPAFARMGATWHDTTSLYGPVFTLGSEGHARAVGDSPDAAAWTYKALAAGAVLAIVLLATRLAPQPAFAAAFVGWNPLLALHFGGGGHNDAWMMALVLGALALLARGRLGAAGAAWALAIGIKWIAAVFVPLVVLARRARRQPLGLGALGAGLAVVAAVAFARYGVDWMTAFTRLSEQARRTGSLGLGDVLGDLGLGHRATLALLAAAFAAVYAWLLVQAHRGRARLGLAGGALALAQGWLNPWYAVWAVPLAAVEEDTAARAVALALTAYLLRDAIPV